MDELPPNGQDIAALMTLNLSEQAPMRDYGHNSTDALHTLIEAKKLAYADMARHVCDPAFHRVPVEAMLSKTYAAERARLIDPSRASADAAPGTLPVHGGDTTYLSVVDRAGNIVSLIQSVFASFWIGTGSRRRRAVDSEASHRANIQFDRRPRGADCPICRRGNDD